MFNIVLIHPEIPQNTGNIGRLCVNNACRLHLIEPLGFSLDEAQVRRAGLDYWPHLDVSVHPGWEAFLASEHPARMMMASTRGKRSVYDFAFMKDDYIIFGSEGHGFPDAFYRRYAGSLYRIPMLGDHCRSLNLANAVGIVLYEGLRQVNGW
jgi:tRNA (cytidine/uridine-2'-O-)-methyltransferase